MDEKYLTSFLIGFSSMFTMHFLLEPTWGVDEPRPLRWRMVFNYSIGVAGISLAFLYLHPELWLDLLISISGAAAATVLAHSRDWLTIIIKRDRANGLIEDRKEEA